MEYEVIKNGKRVLTIKTERPIGEIMNEKSEFITLEDGTVLNRKELEKCHFNPLNRPFRMPISFA